MAIAALTSRQIELVAERFRALAEPARLHLMVTLRNGECTVGDLVDITDMGFANVSKHLRVLLAAGFVARRKSGLYVYYSLAGNHVFQLCNLMCRQLEIEASKAHATFSRARKRAVHA